ncbi:MAG: class I SAM-dependent methyltransferase [Terriglobales bacterium]
MSEPIDKSQWTAEAQFFDREAASQALTPLDPKIVERYARHTRHWAIDFQFALTGDLRGKRVLDVGAGMGENSLLLAALGAQVTAIDISPASLEVLRQRAELSGLSGRIETVCKPLEEWRPPESFDIVWVDAFLHHVLSNLPFVLEQLKSFAGARGRFILAEPFAPRRLRQLRMALPIPANGTPGERPLNRSELRLIRACFPGIRTRHFLFLSRLHRFTPRAEMFTAFDGALLRLPVVKLLGGSVVMWT